MGSQPVSDTICCSGDRYRTHQRAVFGGGPFLDERGRRLVASAGERRHQEKGTGRRFPQQRARISPPRQPGRSPGPYFLIKELGRAVPYGIYDLAANSGWVSVGVDHDTAAFAV